MEETRPPIKGEYCYYDKMYQAFKRLKIENNVYYNCLLYTSPSPRDG